MKSILPNTNCGLGHVALGAVSGMLPGPIAAFVSLGFGAYEMMRSKPDSKKLVALGEFGVGFVLGAVVKEKC